MLSSFRGSARVAGQRLGRDVGMQRDERHAVCQHVVHVAGESATLLLDGAAGLLLAPFGGQRRASPAARRSRPSAPVVSASSFVLCPWPH